MHMLFQDIRFSIRQLRKSPGFSLTAILTLALGVSAVTSVFSVVNSVLLKPLGFPNPDRLVMLREMEPDLSPNLLPDNPRHFYNWKTTSKTLADEAIFQTQGYSVSAGTDHPEIIGGLAISPNFFSVLGMEPMLGRSFLPVEATKGHDDEVILSWSAWQRYFQGDPKAVGHTLRIGGTPQMVVGILPKEFSFPRVNLMPSTPSQSVVRPYEIFQPLTVDPAQSRDSGDQNYLAIGQLRPGISPERAQSELNTIQQAFTLARHVPVRTSVVVLPLIVEVAGRVSKTLWLLLAAVAAVLLIACVNLANLQLARAVAREREIAVRAALGASRKRLVWSTLMDNIVLSVAGGGLGILLSFTGVRLFVAAAPPGLPRLNEVHVSWQALLAAAAVSILTAMLFGLLPAMRSMRVSPQTVLQATSSGRVANTREGQRTRHLLVAGEVACTVVLLIVTGLLIRSFSHLLTQQRDFDSGHVTLAQANLYAPQYGDKQDESGRAKARFIDHALEELGRLPGVQSVAMTTETPMAGATWIDLIARPDHPLPLDRQPPANLRWISPTYLDTLRIPLLAGRNLNASDKDHPTNALISAQAARSIWPGEDPLGKAFEAGDAKYTVVGVIADARINDLKSTANMIYIPYWQQPWYRVNFLMRSSQETISADSIRRAIWNIDPQVAIPVLKSLDEQVNDSVATDRFQTMLLSSFGVAALLLALLGVYGVLAYSVSLRQQEFGIRIALGSGKAALMKLVMRQASYPVLGGVLAGLMLAFVAARWVRSLLYETQTADPLAISVSIALLISAAALAAILPARKAASVDPMQVLRNE